jgi:hypothetical protein
MELKSSKPGKISNASMFKPDGMVDTSILKEILDRVNEFD